MSVNGDSGNGGGGVRVGRGSQDVSGSALIF